MSAESNGKDKNNKDLEEIVPVLGENATKVLERRYLGRDEAGEIAETPSGMFHRVAENIAQGDALFDKNADLKQTEETFYKMMANLEFMPNSPTLMNAGRELQQLSACFVLPIEDSMESIFEAVKNTALIHKSGGGTGFSFSKLRASGSRVQSTNGVSSGPVSFMRVFDAATESVKQGGTRRGANMGILRVDHPDILDFITCKLKDKVLANFNISVALTNEFMSALEENREYDLIDPHNKMVAESISAAKVMDTIIQSAWKNGDPGIIFIDRINRDNPTPALGPIESTNPCGEQPLLPYESCNLGSINLTKFVKDKEVDYDALGKVVHKSMHFLDNVISMNKYPLEKIKEMTTGNRKVGLGIMGFSDMLILLGIPYNSEAAIHKAEEIMNFINVKSKKASATLAEKRGAFPNFEGSIHDKQGESKMRNATTTTIAPTGTISIICGVSSGIEPIFAISYVRTVMDNDKLVEVHPLFEKIAKERGFHTPELMEKIAFKGSVKGIDGVPKDVENLFITAHEVSPEWHLRMQAAFQNYTDNAVSKTINFPNKATETDVKKAYMLAYHLRCKGVTIYRDGSRQGQVLTTGSTHSMAEGNNGNKELKNSIPKPRPMLVRGGTQRVATGCGNIYVTINEDEGGNPFEVFLQIGKAGGCAASQTESIGRLVSMGLRSGLSLQELTKQLRGISCHQPTWENGAKVLSCADAIAKALNQWSIKSAETKLAVAEKAETGLSPKKTENGGGNGGNGGTATAVKKELAIGTCPDCAGSLEYSSGCLLCRSCGYSKCD